MTRTVSVLICCHFMEEGLPPKFCACNSETFKSKKAKNRLLCVLMLEIWFGNNEIAISLFVLQKRRHNSVFLYVQVMFYLIQKILTDQITWSVRCTFVISRY